MSKKQRSKSSKQWLQEHFSDSFVKQAQAKGYRSRAVYKLISIQEKDHLLHAGQNIVDLGAAPGSWTQYAAEIASTNGQVFALDILPMDDIAGVTCLQGDFTEQAALDTLLSHVGESKINVVLSDMAPNLSGIHAVDQPKAMYLAELALDFAQTVLASKGSFVVKVFQGENFDEYLRLLRQSFAKVSVRKPPASRSRSREVYLVAKQFCGH